MNEHVRRALAGVRAEGNAGEWPPPDKTSEACPALWAFLTDTEGPEPGTLRDTATLLVFRDGETLKALITDRETSRKLFVTCSGLGTLFTSVEHALTADHPDWRRDKGSPPAGGRRK